MEGIFNSEKNAFKFNITMASVIYKPLVNKDEEGNNKHPALGNLIRYYHSSPDNNSLFNIPVEIHDRKTLNLFIHESVIKLQNLTV